MKSLLIIGGDYLGQKMKSLLTDQGIEEIRHLTGRKAKEVQRQIPEHVDAIIVFIDFVNHNLSKVIKQKAKNKDVPIYFTKRSWCALQELLGNLAGAS